MSNLRPTPETDLHCEEMDTTGIGVCSIGFTRKLERERDEAREELADYKASAERARDVITQAFLRVAKERDEARELMRKASGSLELALEFFNHWDGVPMWAGLQDAQDVIAKVKEVIQ